MSILTFRRLHIRLFAIQELFIRLTLLVAVLCVNTLYVTIALRCRCVNPFPIYSITFGAQSPGVAGSSAGPKIA